MTHFASLTRESPPGPPRNERDRPPGEGFLDEALLRRIGDRAAGYDRENRFFHEDLEELKQAGFLRAAVPERFGGAGLSLPAVLNELARLAYHAPATALALNMHIYWVGAARHLLNQGDTSANWILEEVAGGAVFAAGHGEPGNDTGLADSLVDAVPRGDGGYRFTGRKTWTSLSPAWNVLGVHGIDRSDPANPRIVHAFLRRDAPGIRIVETWDALGLRATRSDDTILDNVPAEARDVLRVLPAGPPSDPLVDGILAWALSGISIVYYGLAKRAFDVAVAGARRRKSLALGGRTYAHHGPTQAAVAAAAVELDAIQAHVERVATDWWNGVDHGTLWPAKFLAAKVHAADGARRVVDIATRIAGAGSLLKTHELERLSRDVRASGFHPPNFDAANEVIGKSYLGVLGGDPDSATGQGAATQAAA